MKGKFEQTTGIIEKLKDFLLEDLLKQAYAYIWLINVETSKACILELCENNLADENFPDEDINILNDEVATKVRWLGNWESYVRTLLDELYVGDDIETVYYEFMLENIKRQLNQEHDFVISCSVLIKRKVRRVKFKAQYTDADANIICITSSDITELYDKEQQKTRIVSQALETAQRANLSQGNMLRNFTSDIRTPLYGINGMLDFALENCNDIEQMKEYIIKARASASELTSLIEKVLEMSVIENGKMVLTYKPFILKDFVQDIASSLEKDAAEKNISMIFEVDDPKLSVINGDYAHWKTAIMNLMQNSIQYGHEGGYVKCSMKSKKVSESEVFAIVTIEDNGNGMNERLKNQVYEPFTVGNNALRGCGLGIPVAKSIVDKAGGLMRIESEPGKGTCVTIELLLKGCEEQDKQNAINHMVRKIDELDFSKFRALVVDDNEIGREITTVKLEHFGLKVDTAMDGDQAIMKLINSPENYYQIVFMDVQMPNKNGLQATMEIREMERHDLSDITIVALTAHAYRDARIDTLEAGMDYHIPLPLDDIKLKEILVRELFDINPEKEFKARGFRIVK